ncbi:TetR/AcrR family transcriptional regulator [Streptomyces spiralis]|uniref:TetR/AcrR family transcriptional regulator n=1 Tax=Streptomyces spiralis TaxID=66376 RepID=UPI0033EA872D
MRAAERVFAEQSVDGAQMGDIVRLAGQHNPSAVQYHFGSRTALADAVMAARQERVERVLAALLELVPGVEARELLAVLVASEASELGTERGRYCLRISAQLSHTSGVRTGIPAPPLRNSAYWTLFERLRGLMGSLPAPVRRERLDLILTMIGAALADRARQYLDGDQPLTGEELFLADLVETSAALLEAPLPGAGALRALSELRRSIS